MNIQQAIKTIIGKQNLTQKQALSVMQQIMTGGATDAQIGGFLTALSIKGETIDEIIGCAMVMRDLSTKVNIKDKKNLVDTCGTGGSDMGLFNISTASAFVVASSGAKVAKHGNRLISSKSGSADVLEKAGVNLSMSAGEIAESVEKISIGFMFSQNHHDAMKYAITARRDLAVRTIFNLLGPLTNPASAPNQVIGVYEKSLTNVFANVLKKMGANHVMIVHSADGLDEISIAGDTFVSELKDGNITEWMINPQDFDIEIADLSTLKAKDAEQSLAIIKQALDGKNGAAKNIITLNAGAAIYVSGKADTLKNGVKKALDILNSGVARQKFDDFVRISAGY